MIPRLLQIAVQDSTQFKNMKKYLQLRYYMNLKQEIKEQPNIQLNIKRLQDLNLQEPSDQLYDEQSVKLQVTQQQIDNFLLVQPDYELIKRFIQQNYLQQSISDTTKLQISYKDLNTLLFEQFQQQIEYFTNLFKKMQYKESVNNAQYKVLPVFKNFLDLYFNATQYPDFSQLSMDIQKQYKFDQLQKEIDIYRAKKSQKQLHEIEIVTLQIKDVLLESEEIIFEDQAKFYVTHSDINNSLLNNNLFKQYINNKQDVNAMYFYPTVSQLYHMYYHVYMGKVNQTVIPGRLFVNNYILYSKSSTERICVQVALDFLPNTKSKLLPYLDYLKVQGPKHELLLQVLEFFSQCYDYEKFTIQFTQQQLDSININTQDNLDKILQMMKLLENPNILDIQFTLNLSSSNYEDLPSILSQVSSNYTLTVQPQALASFITTSQLQKHLFTPQLNNNQLKDKQRQLHSHVLLNNKIKQYTQNCIQLQIIYSRLKLNKLKTIQKRLKEIQPKTEKERKIQKMFKFQTEKTKKLLNEVKIMKQIEFAQKCGILERKELIFRIRKVIE
ncbi:Hypothetical_protein [Hexamita inflata]|uniref:Hypothetical_protein n=1 Tax=Hexamita inflata TaxID=28002 RepID=A0AA86RCK1_9EUKA|nr:Hypothetical protein HINF_LOCUS61467 [Hexamita inflata]